MALILSGLGLSMPPVKVYEDPLVTIYNGDVMDCLSMFIPSTFQVVITSPPYWAQRVYMYQNNPLEGQWGLEESWQDYINRMIEWSARIKKVLRDDGVLWLNMGNKYGGSGRNDVVNRSKNLMGLPYRLILRMCDEQLWLWRNEVPWYKRNAMPSSKVDALSPSWEPFFLLAKSDRTKFRLDNIRVPHRSPEELSMLADRALGQSEVEVSALPAPQLSLWPEDKKPIIESDLGVSPEGINPITSRLYADNWKGAKHPLGANPGDMFTDDYNDWYKNQRERVGFHGHQQDDVVGQHRDKDYAPILTHPGGAAPADVFGSFESSADDFFDVSTSSGQKKRRGKSSDRNYAAFPEKLCVIPILASSDLGDIVLDPFAGTGTVGVVAKKLARKAVLFELNPRDCEEAAFRVREVPMPMETFIEA